MTKTLPLLFLLLAACGEPEGTTIHDDYGVDWNLTASPHSLGVITANLTESWTTSLIQFWTASKPDMLINRVVAAIEGSQVYLYDASYIELIDGQRVGGVSVPRSKWIVLSTMSSIKSGFSLFRVETIYRHEMSHVILDLAAGIKDVAGDLHHQIFSDAKLGQTLITQCTTKPNG